MQVRSSVFHKMSKKGINQVFHEAAEEFSRRATSALGDEVDSVVLYGSVARGQAKWDSDIDILVISAGSSSTRDRLANIGCDLALEGDCPVVISTAHYSRQEFSKLCRMWSPFADNVLREGVALYDNGTFAGIRQQAVGAGEGRCGMTRGPSPEYIARQLQLAEEALDDANHLLGGSRLKAAANRAYYAMFHATMAALASAGVTPPRTHIGASSRFNQHFVNSGRLDRQFLLDLNDAAGLRHDSDYNAYAEVREAVVAQTVERAGAFLAEVKRLVDEPAIDGVG